MDEAASAAEPNAQQSGGDRKGHRVAEVDLDRLHATAAEVLMAEVGGPHGVCPELSEFLALYLAGCVLDRLSCPEPRQKSPAQQRTHTPVEGPLGCFPAHRAYKPAPNLCLLARPSSSSSRVRLSDDAGWPSPRGRTLLCSLVWSCALCCLLDRAEEDRRAPRPNTPISSARNRSFCFPAFGSQ